MSQEENIFCAKRIMVDSIYKQANLEGISVTYAQTIDILNDVNVSNLKPTDIGKVCCLRDGWKYLLENINQNMDLVFLEKIHELIARFDVNYKYLGVPRYEEVIVGGTDWRPEIPDFDKFHFELQKYMEIPCVTDRALKTGFFIMRTQPFKDGNKRVGSFAINKILIENGKGIFNVPVKEDGNFKKMLVQFYKSNDMEPLLEFSHNNCLTGVSEKVK